MTLPYQTPFEPLICQQCATQLAPGLLACPGCGRLVYGVRLQELAAEARSAAEQGDISSALSAWRQALELLPPGSKQHQTVSQQIIELNRALETGAPAAAAQQPHGKSSGASNTGKAAAGLGAIGLLLLKFKTLILVLLTKGKLLLLGLSKAGTLLTMLLSFGVYWTIWGWKFAAGLVLSIYIHEMGHVIALRKYGFKASAPMFIPGIGALIRLQQTIVDPREDAVIGLAGPIYGLGAAAVSAGLFYATKQPIFAAIAALGAVINLFNMIPVWTLDGARGFHALSRPQRLIAAAVVVGAYFINRDGWTALIAIVCVFRAFEHTKVEGDGQTLMNYCALVLLLSGLYWLMQPHLPASARI